MMQATQGKIHKLLSGSISINNPIMREHIHVMIA
jgi:hypothetical protein